jgi:hypothetical protein
MNVAMMRLNHVMMSLAWKSIMDLLITKERIFRKKSSLFYNRNLKVVKQ